MLADSSARNRSVRQAALAAVPGAGLAVLASWREVCRCSAIRSSDAELRSPHPDLLCAKRPPRPGEALEAVARQLRDKKRGGGLRPLPV